MYHNNNYSTKQKKKNSFLTQSTHLFTKSIPDVIDYAITQNIQSKNAINK